MDANRRKQTRYDSMNLTCICVNEKDQQVHEGMGRTLNISKTGILLELSFAAKYGQTMSIATSFNEEVIDLHGMVMHSSRSENGKYFAGIHFTDIDSHAQEVITKFIDNFKSNFK